MSRALSVYRCSTSFGAIRNTTKAVSRMDCAAPEPTSGRMWRMRFCRNTNWCSWCDRTNANTTGMSWCTMARFVWRICITRYLIIKFSTQFNYTVFNIYLRNRCSGFFFFARSSPSFPPPTTTKSVRTRVPTSSSTPSWTRISCSTRRPPRRHAN